jgi:hypothetical protein
MKIAQQAAQLASAPVWMSPAQAAQFILPVRGKTLGRTPRGAREFMKAGRTFRTMTGSPAIEGRATETELTSDTSDGGPGLRQRGQDAQAQ